MRTIDGTAPPPERPEPARLGVAAVGLLLLLAPLLHGCPKAVDPGAPAHPDRGVQSPGLYAELGCGGCHGALREGTRTAPPLTELGRHWDEDGLVAFLKEPARVAAATPRLQILSEGYAVKMAPVPTDDDTLRSLARTLLAEREASGG